MPSRVNRKWQNGDSDSSFNSSKNSDHHEVKYSRMSKHRLLFSAMSSPRKSRSLFDKTFNRPNASMSYNKITKTSRRPRVSEVERCTNITQREQYKLLIEQYRKNSLAETAKIFCKNQNFAKLEPTTIKEMPIIDLSETDTSPAPVAPQPSSNTSFQTSTVKRFPPTQAHRMPPKPLERISQSTSPINGTKQVTPVQMSHPKIDWFSPSSPYLCKNFVSDLIGTYGRRERDRKRIVQEEETRARLLREKREKKEEILAEMLRSRLRVDQQPQLSDEMEEIVSSALRPNPPHEVLVEKYNISMTREHIMSLAGLNWLNDEIINFYMELIASRSASNPNLPSCHAMNTFFYPKLKSQGYKSVRRWTKRVDIFSKDMLFYPIHLGVHWTLAVVRLNEKRLEYYDSMGATNDECLEILKSYLVDEHLDKKKVGFDVSDWKCCNMPPSEIPQQMNGSDCGVFTCSFAEHISRNSKLTFRQNDMPSIRRIMVWEIMNGQMIR